MATLRKLFLVYIVSLLLTACSVSDLPFLYRPDRQQGTIITQKKVAQLKPGMSRKQVEFLLGTPTLKDPFHPNRWDYVYELIPGDGSAVKRTKLSVFFSDDKLVGARGAYVAPGSALGNGVPREARK